MTEPQRPSPLEALNAEGAPPVVAREAATVILLRGAGAALEVLLVQRNPRATFMGGAWVFPGGAVKRRDGDEPEQALRTAALRELEEEAGVTLEHPHELVKFSRWITPRQVTIRFDTHFYLAPAPDGVQPRVDGGEVVDLAWMAPAHALAENRAKRLTLVFPTIKHLEQLAGFASADELMAYARTREVVPVEPQIVLDGGEVARIVLPGEEG